MIFEDPIRTLRVELPSGWTYDYFNSTLTDFVFNRWNRPELLLIVHVRRALVPSNGPETQWIERIRTEAGENTPIIDMSSNHGRAVAATFTSEQGWKQRVAFVRGSDVEMAIEQRGIDPGLPNPWAALEKAVLTASSDANLELSGSFGRSEFNQSIEAANVAFEKKDGSAVVNALKEAVRIGTSTWLRSLSSEDNAPEINAAVRTAQTMAHLGRFIGGPFLPRDAEFVLRRAQNSLKDAGSDIASSGEFEREISEIIEGIMSDLFEGNDPGGETFSPILAARERGFRLTQTAAKAFDVQDFDNARSLSGAAVDGLLSLIAFLRRSRSQVIDEEIAAHLSSEGFEDPEEQKDIIQKAREAVLFPPLNMALQIQYCSALERKDSMGALDAADVLVPVAQWIFTTNPGEAGPGLNLGLAWMEHACASALVSGTGDLDGAMQQLAQASQVLDAMGDQRCANDEWIRYHGRQIDGSLLALDRILAASDPCATSHSKGDLQTLRSEFVRVADRFRETLARCSSP